MTTTKFFDWRSLVVEADPEFNKDSRINIEYEFTSRRTRTDMTHENGMRVFKGDYQTRGAYATITSEQGVLTWNGGLVTWDGAQITWT